MYCMVIRATDGRMWKLTEYRDIALAERVLQPTHEEAASTRPAGAASGFGSTRGVVPSLAEQ